MIHCVVQVKVQMSCVRDTSISTRLPAHKRQTGSPIVSSGTSISMTTSGLTERQPHTGLNYESRSWTNCSLHTTSLCLRKTDNLSRESRSTSCASPSVTLVFYQTQFSGGPKRHSAMVSLQEQSHGFNTSKNKSVKR